MSEITPITREEKLWNGEDLEPLTREEMYIKRIFDKTQTIPDKPLTRKEILMEKAGEGGGGDVTIKQLSVTANGTYSEEGTAYSPVNVAVPLAEKSVTENGIYNASDDSVAGYSKVNVNVPLPENAYLLKTASGSLVSFDDGADLPIPSFICNIDPVQDLHGYDSPWVGGSGKNKLQNTETTTENNGITFTVNSDGSVKANGTATADAVLNIIVDTSKVYGDLYFVGCNGGSNNTYNALMWDATASARPKKWDGTTASANSIDGTFQQVKIVQGNNVKFQIRVMNGQTVNNVIFQPMICLSTETDPTFAPYSNICPISGHTGLDAWVKGKNLIDMPNRIISTSLSISTISCESCTATKNGEVITATITGAWSKLSIQVKNGIQLKNGETYTFSATFDNPNGNRIGLTHRYLNGSWNTLTSVVTDTHIRLSGSFTYDSSINDYVICSCLINNTNASTNNTVTVKDIMLEKGSTVSDWNAYNPNSQTIQVSWQTEAGEVFGGYIDLVSGKLTATHIITTYDGSNDENWGQNTSYNLFNISIPSDYRVEQTPISNLYKGLEPQSASNLSTKANGSFALYSTYGGINIKTDVAEDVAGFKTYLSQNNLQVLYKLATPQTYQLTPTQIKSLLGNNNAWCDTGDVNVDYFAKEV